jgi:serine phosphatase RsbU (regulator of sigma subunit)
VTSTAGNKIRHRPSPDQVDDRLNRADLAARKVSRDDVLFFAFFALYTAIVLLWLTGGLAAALSAVLPSVGEDIRAWGEGTNFFASVARVIALAATEVPERAALPPRLNIDLGYVVVLDYSISAVGVGLAMLVIWLRPREFAARLLALGMMGVAVAYNDLSHVIFSPLPGWVFEPGPHFIVHVVAGATFAHALLVFPDGRLRPAWARWPLVAIYAFVAPISTFVRQPLVFFILFYGLLLPAVGITSQVSRYRHASSPRERQQSRLLLWALGVACVPGGMFVLLNAIADLDTSQTRLAFLIFQPVLGVIPVALTVGLLRYRLWDIDRVINRALVYALLTGALALLYLVTVYLLGNSIKDFANPAAALVSTFAAAALFSPARRNVQSFIDRRFYRERHNAAQTLNAFAERLHQEVDLDSLIAEVLAAIQTTIRPKRVTLWLRSPAPTHRLEAATDGPVAEAELQKKPGSVSFLTFEGMASGGRRGAPRRLTEEQRAYDDLGVPVDVPIDDPALSYFEENVVAFDIDTLKLDSRALEILNASGVTLVLPLVSHRELIGLLNLGPRLSGQTYSTEDRKLLTSLASQAASAVRVAQLVRQQAEDVRSRERFAQELRVAQLIQLQFLPRQLPKPENWKVAAYYQPARFVGGDFYDFIELEDGQLGIVVGDVSGKGVPSALVMAHTHGVLREGARRFDSPGKVLAYANDLLLPEMPPRMFVTCAYAILDPKNGGLRFANAGHCLPYLSRQGSVAELRATGMPLGLVPALTYQETETTLVPGHQVLFHSDGITEAHGREGELFGSPRLMNLMNEAHGADRIIELLQTELHAFTGPGWEQEDDITLVALQWRT